MQGVYDRPLRDYIRLFQEGWHVVLEAEGASRPIANLGQHPDSGRVQAMSVERVPLQELSPEELERTMVREVQRESGKRTILLVLPPALLQTTRSPEVDPAPPGKLEWLFDRVQRLAEEWIYYWLLGLWILLIIAGFILWILTRKDGA
jgi:hypothetical protein